MKAKWILVLAGVAFAAAPVLAQTPLFPGREGVTLVSSPQFWIALIVGAILAVAFQLVLTSLSVAAGVTVLGPIQKRVGMGKAKETHPAGESEPEGHGGKSGSGMSLTKISTGFGLWTLITTSGALFFAAWLAVELILAPTATEGAVMALAIWGLFFVVMTVLEISAISGLLRMAASGVRSAVGSVTSVFSKSQEDHVSDAVGKAAKKLREELFETGSGADLGKKLSDYLDRMQPGGTDPGQLRKELSKLLNDTEIEAISTRTGPLLDEERLVARLRVSGRTDGEIRKTVGSVRGALSAIREEYSAKKSVSERFVDAAVRIATGKSSEEASSTRQSWEEYLRRTGKEELNPESIKRDVERLMKSPGQAKQVLQERAGSFNKDTAVALLEQRGDMSHDEAMKTAERIESIISDVRGKGAEITQTAQAGIEEKIADFLNSMARPELRYEEIKEDVKMLFHDPKAGADALIARMKSLDRETLKALVMKRKNMSPEDAERIVEKIEAARDEVVLKAEKTKVRIEDTLRHARDEALEQAEETRKGLAAAAWWVFGTAVVSAIAAVIGGIIASGS